MVKFFFFDFLFSFKVFVLFYFFIIFELIFFNKGVFMNVFKCIISVGVIVLGLFNFLDVKYYKEKKENYKIICEFKVGVNFVLYA